MIKLYYHPGCSKCRIAKENLESKKLQFKTIEYLKENLTLGEIEEIINKGNFEPEEILRKNESEYKEFVEGQFLSDREIIGLILNHPKILQRPIIVTKDNAIIARDEENLKLIKDL